MAKARDKWAKQQRLVERLCPTDSAVDKGSFYKAVTVVAKHYQEDPGETNLAHIVKLAIDSGASSMDTLIRVASSKIETSGHGKMKKGHWLQILQGQTSVTLDRKVVIIGAIVDHFMNSDDMRSWQARQTEEKAEAASSANGKGRHVPKESGHAHERFTGHATGTTNGNGTHKNSGTPKQKIKPGRRVLHDGFPIGGVK